MFERFTERARQVVVMAQEEARLGGYGYIGSEHILVGLIREQEGLAARVLDQHAVYLEAVRAAIPQTPRAGQPVTPDQVTQPPMTPRAKRVFELALREALSLGHNYIGTEHILLGLLKDDEGTGARILRSMGVDAEKVRQATVSWSVRGAGKPKREHRIRTIAGQVLALKRLASALEATVRDLNETSTIEAAARTLEAGTREDVLRCTQCGHRMKVTVADTADAWVTGWHQHDDGPAPMVRAKEDGSDG